MDRDGPGIDGPRQGLAVAVDDVAALRDQRGYPALATGVIAERREITGSAATISAITPAYTSIPSISRWCITARIWRRWPTRRSRSGRGRRERASARSLLPAGVLGVGMGSGGLRSCESATLAGLRCQAPIGLGES